MADLNCTADSEAFIALDEDERYDDVQPVWKEGPGPNDDLGPLEPRGGSCRTHGMHDDRFIDYPNWRQRRAHLYRYQLNPCTEIEHVNFERGHRLANAVTGGLRQSLDGVVSQLRATCRQLEQNDDTLHTLAREEEQLTSMRNGLATLETVKREAEALIANLHRRQERRLQVAARGAVHRPMSLGSKRKATDAGERKPKAR